MATNRFGIPDTYRGFTISQDADDQFRATPAGQHRDEDDLSAETWDELIDVIDLWFEDNGQFGVGA